MTTVNGNFLKFPGVYLFQEIAHQVAAFKKTAPEKRVISLGIGDVTQPLAPAVIRALHSAVDEMGNAATFRGYGPEQATRSFAKRSRRMTIRTAGSRWTRLKSL